MSIDLLTGPQDLAELRTTLNTLIRMINQIEAGTFTEGIRSTFNGQNVLPASQATAGFEITSNYAGTGEVNFWNLVNNTGDGQGWTFEQKTGASTKKTVVAIYSDSTFGEFAVYGPAGTFVALGSDDAEAYVTAQDPLPLSFHAGGATRMTITSAGRFILPVSVTPASSSAAGVAGTIAWDSGFIYVCISTNSWKRVAIAAGF